jgi:hypothetical protein
MSTTTTTTPPANTVATTTAVGTPAGTVAATATLPSWLSGAWIAFYGILLFVFICAYWFGAAKLSYDHSNSPVWAFLAFLFAPFYYPFYAFFVSKPASTGMFGGGKSPIRALLKKFGL